jgi:hypothetical protein
VRRVGMRVNDDGEREAAGGSTGKSRAAHLKSLREKMSIAPSSSAAT